MTLRELILSVDGGDYVSSPLFQQLRSTKPEYGSNKHIEVRQRDGRVVVYNVHVGSLGDIVASSIDVDSDVDLTEKQLLDAILKEMSEHGESDAEQTDYWNDFTNLQKAKIIR